MTLSSTAVFLLFFFVLFVNLPIIHFAMLYPEQPSIYLANQEITQFKDLLEVYFHPILLNNAIPFFRPSGHFLIYQLLTPILGWHSIKALIMVNLFFLSLCGFLIIKIYSLLFPKFKVGGYIAFALYLMHPALSLSRLIALHFEFAYVFFTLLSLYCVMIFCQRNTVQMLQASRSLQSMYMLMMALFSYVLAVTFKEPAILLGPVLALYICFYLYHSSLKQTVYFIFQQKQIVKILILMTIVSLILVTYMTLPWPSLSHPTRVAIQFKDIYAASIELIKIMLASHDVSTANHNANFPEMIWRGVIFPKVSQGVIWFFWGLIALLSITLLRGHEAIHKKNFLFLIFTVLLFLILPMTWAMGLAWHLNLSILFLSLLMGFSFEAVFKKVRYKEGVGYFVAFLIALSSWNVNTANVNRYDKNPYNHFVFSLIRNSMLSPPDLHEKLNDESVLVVEDSEIHNPYLLGNSLYPLFLANNYSDIEKVQPFYFSKVDHLYNGTLFRFAYLKPHLKEEVYPFEINKMAGVADGAIYHWLQHIDNIFCVGYDAQGFWHDRTAEFKANLLDEQQKRSFRVSEFSESHATKLTGQLLYASDVLVPDVLMCQLNCDRDPLCKGFTFIYSKVNVNKLSQCQFYSAIDSKDQFCASCQSYVKHV